MATSAVDFDRRRKLTLGLTAAALIVLLGAIWMMIRPASNSPDAPGGTFWICQSCGNHFNVSTRDLHKFQAEHYGERYPCPKCKGEGRLLRQRTVDAKVPAGVEDGTRIRFSGLGEAGTFGGPAGDLYVVLHVKEHSFFAREGNDLHCVIPISFTQAALGTELTVPTLEGEHKLKVPEGTQSGATFRLRNKGVPVLNDHGKGDLFIEVQVQTPGKLNKRQRELLQELDQLTRVENKPQNRTLLGKVKDIFG